MVNIGDKVHVIYRMLYEKSTRRHFAGEITAFEGVVCKLEGYVFIYDPIKSSFIRKPELRTTIIDLAESGYVVNVLPDDVNLQDITYQYTSEKRLIATDNREFSLDINEFGAKN